MIFCESVLGDGVANASEPSRMGLRGPEKAGRMVKFYLSIIDHATTRQLQHGSDQRRAGPWGQEAGLLIDERLIRSHGVPPRWLRFLLCPSLCPSVQPRKRATPKSGPRREKGPWRPPRAPIMRVRPLFREMCAAVHTERTSASPTRQTVPLGSRPRAETVS